MHNLYGGAMVEHLPVRDFRSLSEKETPELDILNVDKDASTGYILEGSQDIYMMSIMIFL